MDRNNQDIVTVRVRQVLEFFDEIPSGSVKHATAIVAVAGEDLGSGLLKHWLEQTRGAKVEILHDGDSRPYSVTTGRRKGPRLDRWIEVRWPDGTVTLFQCEVKNWSAHAYEGRKLKVAANAEEVSKRMMQEWKGMAGNFAGPLNAVNKVLVPMMRPPHANQSAELAPLLIYWVVVHPEGRGESFFWHPLGPNEYPEGCGRKFERLAVFSMSSYLRSLLEQKKEATELWMPEAARRMPWLNKLFTI